LKSGISNGIIYAEVAFDKDAPASKAFFDAYTTKYGAIDGSTPPVYIASAYDALHILADMIKQNGDNVEKVKAGLYAIKDRAGASGALTMDKNGDAVKEYTLKVIKNGASQAYTQ
jgi:ABC-type branched-subunit amino acid transport system substrate-binding protein